MPDRQLQVGPSLLREKVTTHKCESMRTLETCNILYYYVMIFMVNVLETRHSSKCVTSWQYHKTTRVDQTHTKQTMDTVFSFLPSNHRLFIFLADLGLHVECGDGGDKCRRSHHTTASRSRCRCCTRCGLVGRRRRSRRSGLRR